MLLRTVSVVLSLLCCILLIDFSMSNDFHMHPMRMWRTFSISKRHTWPRLEHKIEDCISMISEEGQYVVEPSEYTGDTCGIYIFSDPKEVIEITLEISDVPCETGGLVAFIDGWELNGQFYPSSSDHHMPLEERIREFCDNGKAKYILRSSQNVALLQYRLPMLRTGFKFFVRLSQNPTPCNVLLQDTEAILTLSNFGKQSNCSVSALFPTYIKVLAMNIGEYGNSREIKQGTIIHKCESSFSRDALQIGCSNELDTGHLNIVDEICGIYPGKGKYDLFNCGISTVRLVSSGAYDNIATIFIQQLNEENFNNLLT